MHNKYLITIAMLGLSGSLHAASPQWPADALDESDPRVQTFYAQQCDQWTEQSKLQGEARGKFLANCMGSAARIWPVGSDNSSGGGEG